MGEYSGDSAVLDFILANHWDSENNGTGTPQIGMIYYDTTANQVKAYTNVGWSPLNASEPNASIDFTYDVYGNVIHIDKTIGSITYRKTLTWDDGLLINISEWVEQ